MQLPSVEDARVEQAKLLDYLLNQEHPEGKSKAAFFLRFGFRAASWDVLAEALRNHAFQHEVQKTVASSYGVRYVIEGPLETPDERAPLVRTVWMIDEGTSAPRLITAYPL